MINIINQKWAALDISLGSTVIPDLLYALNE